MHARRIGALLNGAFRRIAAGTLQEQLRPQPPAELTLRTGVPRHALPAFYAIFKIRTSADGIGQTRRRFGGRQPS